MGVAIRAAGEDDRELVVRLLDESFRDDPVSSWVFPDAEYRRRTHHRLMGAFTDVVLADGRIDLTEDGAACALWLSMPASDDAHGSAGPADPDGPVVPDGRGGPNGPVGPDGPDGRGGEAVDPAVWMRETVDPANPRVEEIVRLLDATHPVGRAHEYLWMIAVAPDRQGAGLGGALVRHVLDRCDREGLPAYLEASSPRSTRLYERLGFAYTGTTVDLPDGPRMWPMWREPGTGDRTAEEL